MSVDVASSLCGHVCTFPPAQREGQHVGYSQTTGGVYDKRSNVEILAPDAQSTEPVEGVGMRAARRWFHDTRVMIEERRAETGNSFAAAAAAHLGEAERKLAGIVEEELNRK